MLPKQFIWQPDNTTQQFISFQPWLADSIVHGFGGANLDFVKVPGYSQATNILFLKQNHGPEIYDARTIAQVELLEKLNTEGKLPECDAVIFNKPAQLIGKTFAIKTADCIPLIIRKGSTFALVHAGWRGLANRITSKVLSRLMQIQDSNKVEVLIGPCAGSLSYEVGQEVIDQIGETVVATNSSKDKYLLNMSTTVFKEIILTNQFASVHICDQCTISSKNFFSYRRQAQQAGRNVTFVCI